MPKIKSNRGAAKRFRAAGNRSKAGKTGFKSASANRRHINSKMSTKRKRKLRAGMVVRKSELGRLDQMLPYA